MTPRDAEFDRWPPSYQPDRAKVFAHNEILVGAPPERPWEWLVRANAWPRWYVNARRVRILNDDERLQDGTRFGWVTFGTSVQSTVDIFSPPYMLGWRWRGRGSDGYHVWLLQPHPGGTRVVTEETQFGPGPSVLRALLAPTLWLSHEIWLRSLARNTERRWRSG
jgi:uncharacterized protein YndB with AHSA1/START domain